MSTALLYAVSHVTGNVSSPNNALGAPDNVWTADGNQNSSWTSRWRLDAVAGNFTPSGTQSLTLRARKGSNSGDPDITQVRLFQNNTAVATLSSSSQSITSTTGQDLVYTFAGSLLAGFADVDIEVQVSAAGGGPTVRNSVEVDAFTWEAAFALTPAVGSLSAQEAGQDTLSASGSLGLVPLSGSLASQEAGQDTLSAAGVLPVAGALAAQETQDVFSAAGQAPLGGSMAAQETGQDLFRAYVPRLDFLHAASFVSGNVSSPNNALGGFNFAFTTDGNTNTSWTARWRMASISGRRPADLQGIFPVVRKGSNSGNPSVEQIRLLKDGVVVANLLAAPIVVTSTLQQTPGVSAPQAALFDDYANVDIEIVTNAVGGGTTVRNAVELDSIQWATNNIPIEARGRLSTQEPNDAFAASGTVTNSNIGIFDTDIFDLDIFDTPDLEREGALAAQESPDLAFFTGQVAIAGQFAVAETGSDALAATGQVLVSGALAAQEQGQDTPAFTGEVAIAGQLTAQEQGQDAFAAIGFTIFDHPFGTLAAQEDGQDTLSASGLVPVQGQIAAQEPTPDTLSASGQVLVQGQFAAQEEGQDAFNGTSEVSVFGALFAQEPQADSFSGAGLVPVQGLLLAIEAADIAIIAGRPNGTILRYWDGSQWREGELRIWNGARWPGALARRWDGSQWNIQP